ncbi:MAG: hypothetical protein FJ387_23315 [Verrucomicrobia bacterium]|nr:hypothetical protein [Verrucomicrobiota bacterium]
MPHIKAEQLQEGMVALGDVKNIDQMLLIPAGTVLTARHLNILRAWGVSEVEVVAGEGVPEPVDPMATLPPEVLAQLGEDLRARFFDWDDANLASVEVFRLMVQRQARRQSGA